jgi:uncharacterized protein YndB with AHSA1/START domain
MNNKSEFAYTTYIKTTPEKVWQAITTPEFTRQYWSNENISDWKKGSEWKHVDPQSKQTRVVGKVIESNPPTRLVTSWASPSDLADESLVAYDISMAGDLVRLDVTHTRLSADMGSKVSGGWPLVLSSLKSFLETGKAIDIMSVKGPCQDAA